VGKGLGSRKKMIFIILVFGFILRLINLNQSLWLDEGTTAIVARDFSYSKILTEFSTGDFHPPFHYLFLKFWSGIFGVSEISLRLPSVIAGILTVWFVYLLVKKIYDKSTAILSALFLAVNPLHIYYSQEARMYSLETLFSAIVVWALVCLIKSNNPTYWFILSIASIVLLYTDYLPLFLLLSLGIYAVIFQRSFLRRNSIFILLSSLGIGILYLPWLPSLVTQLKTGLLVKSEVPAWWSILGNTNIKQLALVPIKFSIGRISMFNNYLYMVLVGPVLLVYLFIFASSLKNLQKSILIWFWLVGPIALIAIFGLWISVFSYFRLLFVLPAFCILLAVGCLYFKSSIRRVLTGFVILVSVTSSVIYLFNPSFHREDWKSAVGFIEQNSKDKNAKAVFVTEGQRDPYYYYSKSVVSSGPQGVDGSFDTIWLMRYVQPIFDPEDTLRNRVESDGYKKVGEYDFNGVTVWKYEKTINKACAPGLAICLE
jgi:4-amino-4-deoxy-L-arabinose transferase-like glycosyltransferase